MEKKIFHEVKISDFVILSAQLVQIPRWLQLGLGS